MTNLQHSLSDLGLDSQRFTNKDDIKPWLQNYLLHKKGIHVVIARSDANKIIFRCKSDKNKDKTEKLNTGSRRQTSCPFKIRANYSIRNHIWTLVIINENHDHELDSFSLIQQSKLAYLFNHKNDESGLLSLGSDDSTALTSTSKSNPSSDVFSSFIPSSEMVSPNEANDNHNLTLSIVDLKDSVTSKDNSDSERVIDVFEGQKIKKRKVLGGHNIKRKKPKSDSITVPEEVHDSQEDKSQKEVIDDLREQVNSLISNVIINSQRYSDKEKSIMIKSFFSSFINDYKSIINTVANQQKMVLSSWFSAPNATQSNLHSHANTNLIPLSPLLNDTDTEYANTTPNNSNNQSIENLTHLPNMSLGSSLIANLGGSNNNTGPSNSNANNYNNFIVPPQMQLLQIQNQNQQLPSFNTIQNQLPLSPTSLANNSTASLFVNNFNGTSLNSNSTSLIPPISNSSTNTTLNPSHLLKSSNNKNVFSNLNLSGTNNLLSRNEYKQSGSLNPIGNNVSLSNTMSLNSNQSSGTISNFNTLSNSNANYGGLSSPNNNIINPNAQNSSANGAFYNKEILSASTGSIPQSSTTSNTSGTLNHIASLNDNGW